MRNRKRAGKRRRRRIKRIVRAGIALIAALVWMIPEMWAAVIDTVKKRPWIVGFALAGSILMIVCMTATQDQKQEGTNGREVLEIGYLFERAYWHNGYATEAARACKTYAFEVLKAEEVCSIIRDTNTASQRVAARNGMMMTDTSVKHYRGVAMPHGRYAVRR